MAKSIPTGNGCEIAVPEALEDYVAHLRAVTEGRVKPRHECHGGACDAKRFPPSQYGYLGVDFHVEALDWDEACLVLRPLFQQAMDCVEDSAFCLQWTVQGPKRDGGRAPFYGVYVRVTFVFPLGPVSKAVLIACLRGEESHSVHGEYAQVLADVLSRTNVIDETDMLEI